MEQITSFSIDHDILTQGMYVSQTNNNIVTYDIRMKVPNSGDYLDQKGLHTFEHLFATYARNTKWSKNIVYIGPMGCRTGFYFLTQDMKHSDAIKLIQDSLEFISNYTGEIPGSKKKECGNYLEHDLESAKKIAADMIPFLKDWNESKLKYPTK